ncbi:MAG TPA: GNAT family N-acetyltransferase [Pyrinomonadaceae bacterium]|mgnify:CR=1 FL=1|nr:GNAT family N-acetyltransferase [Pyrinomonadaceae bacterium]
MNIEIKRATVAEAEYIALLARVTFREAFAKDAWTDDAVLRDYLSATFSVEKIRASIAKENNVYWVAFADGLPAGYAKLKKFSPYEKLDDDSPAQLQKIYVLNDLIGNRIGEKLQNALFDTVAGHNIRTLWLAVWDKNDKAIRFYERHGFRKETKYHYDYKTMSFDYEVMVKTFQP